MKYEFDLIPSREGTSCIKYDKRTEEFGEPDVIPMWIADMDFAVAPFIIDAIKNRAENPVYGYDFVGDDDIYAIKGWLSRRSGWEVDPGWLMFLPGVVPGLVVGINAFTDTGDGIVIQPPVYPPFAGTIQSNGREVMSNPLKITPSGFEIDFEDLEEKLSRSKALMLCNPHNPTGRVFTKDELVRMGEMCVKHDVYIISDEIHSDIVYRPNQHIHIASLSPEIARRTVTLISPSKTFNIAGLYSSVAIASDRTTFERFDKMLKKNFINHINTFGNVAIKAAYGFGDEWLNQLLAYLKGNIDYTVRYFAEHMPLVRTYPPEGTFLMWLDFSGLGMGQGALKDFLVNKAGLGLSNGIIFGREGDGYMRMNIATSRTKLAQALYQLRDAYLSIS